MLLGLTLGAWVIVLVTLLFAALLAQVSILHYRGAFHRLWMWEPVIYLPVVILLGIIALAVRGVMLQVYWISLILAALMGLAGLVYHVQGVFRQVGGWNLDNVMVGPPVLLPFTITLISLIGMASAILWR